MSITVKAALSGVVSGGKGSTGPTPVLSVTINFPGGDPVSGDIVYDIADGVDMGSYTAPTAGFTQRCIRVRNNSVPNYFVDFRPDVSGGRIEVVFWNGEVLGTVPTRTFRNLPAYTAVVKLNGVTQSDWRGVSTTSIPYHYWANRWRFQTALRPGIRTPSQVFSEGFLPEMSLAAARESGYTGVIVPTVPSIPSPANNNGKNGDGSAMTSGADGYLYLFPMIPDDITDRLWGISCAGDDGGYRDEQGLITKWQADWLLNETDSSLNTIMQQAEFFACQANALFLPDQVNGGPINQKADLTRYSVSTYNYGSYYLSVTGGSNSLSSGGFFGSINTGGSGDVLTVSSSPFAPILVGMVLKSASISGITYDGILPGTYIVSQLSGATGDIGTYQLSQVQTASPAAMAALATVGEFRSKGEEHSPQILYLPWVLTEDPFYAEAEQYTANYGIQQDIYYKENLIGNLAGDPTGLSGVNGPFTLPPALPGYTEERATGWGVKRIASCYVMSPTSPPSWLLSKANFAAYSSDLSRFIDYVQEANPTDQFYTVFNSVVFNSSGDTPQSFYKAYVAYCFGFADLVGLPVPAVPGHAAPSSWFDQLTYMFNFIRQTCDPALSSGFNCQSPIIHDLGSYLITNLFGTSGCTVGTSTVPPSGTGCVTTYAGLETYSGAYNRDTSPYPSNPSPGYIGGNAGNLGPLYAGAAVANSRGVTGAAAVQTWLGSMIDYSFPQPGYGISFNPQDGFTGS